MDQERWNKLKAISAGASEFRLPSAPATWTTPAPATRISGQKPDADARAPARGFSPAWKPGTARVRLYSGVGGYARLVSSRNRPELAELPKFIADDLAEVAGPPSLPLLNLIRGEKAGLTDIHQFAKHCKRKGCDVAALEEQEPDTPLWYGLLREAEQAGQGGGLGPCGSWFLLDVIAGAVGQLDRLFQPRDLDAPWQPPQANTGRYGVRDLLETAWPAPRP